MFPVNLFVVFGVSFFYMEYTSLFNMSFFNQ